MKICLEASTFVQTWQKYRTLHMQN